MPAELEERNEFAALIFVRPVPPLAIPVILSDLQAVPSYFQVFPLPVKIWFVTGDVGKSSAVYNSKRGY